jgi:RNA polymerase sigma-70 factor (ECF subfamily)
VSEEIVQTTFVRSFDSLDTLRNPELFYNWLFSIARNEVYGYIRQKRKNGTVHSLEEEENVWDTESPLILLVRKETSELVLGVINQLKPEYREVLFLRQYDRLSYSQIAALTGDSISSVESRLFKARKALATKLNQYLK